MKGSDQSLQGSCRQAAGLKQKSRGKGGWGAVVRERLERGVGPVGKDTGCRAELRYYEHLAERRPY